MIAALLVLVGLQSTPSPDIDRWIHAWMEGEDAAAGEARAELMERPRETLALLLEHCFATPPNKANAAGLVRAARLLRELAPHASECFEGVIQLEDVGQWPPFRQWARREPELADAIAAEIEAGLGGFWNEVGIDGVEALIGEAIAGPRTFDWCNEAGSRLAEMVPAWTNAAVELEDLLGRGGDLEVPWIARLLYRTPDGRRRIVTFIEDAEPDLRRRALIAARACAEDAVLLAPIVAAYLEDPDPEVRYEAAFTLARMTPDSIPLLIRLVEDERAEIRSAAVEGIERAMWPHMTGLASKESGAFAAWHGGMGAGLAGYDAIQIVAREGVQALATALADEEEDVRAHAALALYKLGLEAAPARSALEIAAKDEASAVALFARESLNRLDEKPWDHLCALRRALRESGSPVPEDLAALEDLVARAESDGTDAERAAETLDALERDSKIRIAELLEILDDTFGVGDRTARKLVALGEASMPAIAHDFLRFPRFPMGLVTYIELAWVMREQRARALPAWIEGLEHWREGGRLFAVDGIAKLAPDPRLVMPFVLSSWRCQGNEGADPSGDGFWENEEATPDSLGFFEDEVGVYSVTTFVQVLGAGAIPYLVRGLEDPHVLVRLRCCRGLTAFGQEAKVAADALERLLNDREPCVRRAAAEALIHLSRR